MVRTFAAAPLLLLVGLVMPAGAQFGRGLPAYRSQGTASYQFGYKPAYEILVVNAALQDVEFRLTRAQDEHQQWAAGTAAWVVPAGTFGTIDIVALDMQGMFVTRRGVRIPGEPVKGAYYATFVIDEELLREFESRNEKGAVVIRTFEGARNPDIEDVRLTTHTELLARVLREARLLPSPREKPGPERGLVTHRGGGFPNLTTDVLPDVDESTLVATSGRIRQPGEEFVTLYLTRAGGEIPAGARYTIEIGHDLASRVESGAVDGEGRIRLFTTRDRNVRLRVTVAGDPSVGADATTVEIDPSRDTTFRVRIR